MMTDFRPQLAVPCKDINKLKFPLLAEPKLDGVRCVCIIKDGKPSFWSRDGKPFVNFEELEGEVESLGLRNAIIDGEIMSVSGKFDDTISRSRSHRGVNTHIDYVYNVFDVLVNPEPLGTIYQIQQRKVHLLSLFDDNQTVRIKHVPCTIVSSKEDLLAQHEIHVGLKYEGTMVKPLDSFYHQGRNQDWKKIKPFLSADLFITGIHEGKGKQEGMMGALSVDGKLEDGTHVECLVGTGFSDELRKEIWNNKLNYFGKFIEVQYQEVTKDNSLRFPSFKRFRNDKDAD